MIRIFILCIIFITFPCSATGGKDIDARLKLKKWGMAYCLFNRYGDKMDSDSGGALDGYFQLGKHNSENAYEAVRKYFNESISKNKKVSVLSGKKNILMACLDAYESEEYIKIIEQQDKWIQ